MADNGFPKTRGIITHTDILVLLLPSYSVQIMRSLDTSSVLDASSQSSGEGNSMSHMKYHLSLISLWWLTHRDINYCITMSLTKRQILHEQWSTIKRDTIHFSELYNSRRSCKSISSFVTLGGLQELRNVDYILREWGISSKRANPRLLH